MCLCVCASLNVYLSQANLFGGVHPIVITVIIVIIVIIIVIVIIIIVMIVPFVMIIIGIMIVIAISIVIVINKMWSNISCSVLPQCPKIVIVSVYVCLCIIYVCVFCL